MTHQMTEPREQQLIRASKVRALITSLLSNQPKPITKAEIETLLAEPLKEVGCDSHALTNQLKYMVDGGRIKRQDIPGSRPVFYPLGMVLDTSTDVTQNTPTKLGVTKVTPAVPQPVHTNNPRHVSIDMVKSTGRVRITTQDMIFEIGVVEN